MYQRFVDAAVDTGSRNPLKDPRIREAVLLIIPNHNLNRARSLMKEAGGSDGFSFRVSRRRFTEGGGTLRDLGHFQTLLSNWAGRVIRQDP